jgi:hypothetical protein
MVGGPYGEKSGSLTRRRRGFGMTVCVVEFDGVDRVKPALRDGWAGRNLACGRQARPLDKVREPEEHSQEWLCHSRAARYSVQWVIQKRWLNFCGWRGSE